MTITTTADQLETHINAARKLLAVAVTELRTQDTQINRDERGMRLLDLLFAVDDLHDGLLLACQAMEDAEHVPPLTQREHDHHLADRIEKTANWIEFHAYQAVAELRTNKPTGRAALRASCGELHWMIRQLAKELHIRELQFKPQLQKLLRNQASAKEPA